MDEQPISQPVIQTPQAPQTSVSSNFFSKNKRVLTIISILIILIILAIILFITKSFNIFQNILSNNQNKNIPVINNQYRNLPVGSNTPKTISSFSGKVVGKGANYLTIAGEKETKKITLDPNVNIRIIERTEFLKNPDTYIKQPGKFINIKDIVIGDLVDTSGQYDGTLLKVYAVIVTR